MADIKPIKSSRDQQIERLRKKYPEKEFGDDEAIFGQISEDYDQFEQENSEMRDRERALGDMFISNPRSARLMLEWRDGKDPVASLIRIYGKDEIMAAIDDPERLGAIEEANREFAERVAKNDEYEAEYERNLPESIATIETWQAESGRSDEEVDGAITALSKVCGDFIMGKISPETIELMLRAQNYDRAVAQAHQEGEVSGRNARIEEKLRKGRRGDGISSLNGRNGAAGPQSRGTSIFDLAREAE